MVDLLYATVGEDLDPPENVRFCPNVPLYFFVTGAASYSPTERIPICRTPLRKSDRPPTVSSQRTSVILRCGSKQATPLQRKQKAVDWLIIPLQIVFPRFSQATGIILTTFLGFPHSFPQVVENSREISTNTVGNFTYFHTQSAKSLVFPDFSLWKTTYNCGLPFPHPTRFRPPQIPVSPPFPQISITGKRCGKLKILYNRGEFSDFS